MIDPWTGPWGNGPLDDDPPFLGVAAVLVGTGAALVGALVVAGAVTVLDWLLRVRRS